MPKIPFLIPGDGASSSNMTSWCLLHSGYHHREAGCTSVGTVHLHYASRLRSTAILGRHIFNFLIWVLTSYPRFRQEK